MNKLSSISRRNVLDVVNPGYLGCCKSKTLLHNFVLSSCPAYAQCLRNAIKITISGTEFDLILKCPSLEATDFFGIAQKRSFEFLPKKGKQVLKNLRDILQVACLHNFLEDNSC